MDPINQQKEQASAVIIELVQHAINRNAFSSVEVQALRHAIHLVSAPAEAPVPEKTMDKTKPKKVTNPETVEKG